MTTFKVLAVQAKKLQKIRKMQKALLMMLFSKLDHLIKRNQLAAFTAIHQISNGTRSEETFFINKSQT